nr:hypothetical protein GCM10020093_101750 [Planobispora longispora]
MEHSPSPAPDTGAGDGRSAGTTDGAARADGPGPGALRSSGRVYPGDAGEGAADVTDDCDGRSCARRAARRTPTLIRLIRSPSSPSASPAIPPSTHACAAATQRCEGRISVPLDWDDPGSERIDVAFAWVPRKGATSTVLANPGGPLPALPMLPMLERTVDRQNLLVVEPRGLGESSPLSCPDLDLNRPETIASCAGQVGARGRFFTTDQAVADMDAVRKALGVPEVTFYGISYGTVFAQAYAARFPESTAGVFLDSLVPVRKDGYAIEPIRSRTDLLGLTCRSSRDCEATWSALVRRLRDRPDAEISSRRCGVCCPASPSRCSDASSTRRPPPTCAATRCCCAAGRRCRQGSDPAAARTPVRRNARLQVR